MRIEKFKAWHTARSFWSVMVANGYRAVMSGVEGKYVVTIYG